MTLLSMFTASVEFREDRFEQSRRGQSFALKCRESLLRRTRFWREREQLATSPHEKFDLKEKVDRQNIERLTMAWARRSVAGRWVGTGNLTFGEDR
jgi:hypothetical protein